MSILETANISFDLSETTGIRILNSNNISLQVNGENKIILSNPGGITLNSNTVNSGVIVSNSVSISANTFNTTGLLVSGNMNVSGSLAVTGNLYVTDTTMASSLNIGGTIYGTNPVWSLLKVITAEDTSVIETYTASEMANYRAVRLTFIDVNTSGSNVPLAIYLASNSTTYIGGTGKYNSVFFFGDGTTGNGSNTISDTNAISKYDAGLGSGLVIGGKGFGALGSHVDPQLTSNMAIPNMNGTITFYDFAVTQKTKYLGDFTYSNNSNNLVMPLGVGGMESTLLPMVGFRISCGTSAPAVINGTILVEGIHLNV